MWLPKEPLEPLTPERAIEKLPVIFGRPAVLVVPPVSAQPRKTLKVLEMKCHSSNLLSSPESLRAWTADAPEGAGAWHRDEIRNITGSVRKALFDQAYGTGAFTVSKDDAFQGEGLWYDRKGFDLDASNVVPTGKQNVPQHVWQPVVIYLGASTQV